MSRFALVWSLLTIGLTWGAALSQEVPFPERFGIGATLVEPDSVGTLVVRACSPGGPADQAGLAPGDTLIALDGQSIVGWHRVIVESCG